MRGIVAPLIKLVVFAVITVVATAMLGLTIANAGAGGKTGFKAVFDDAAMLNPGDDVRIAGVRVGQVEGVEIKDRNKALVTFNVDRDSLPAGPGTADWWVPSARWPRRTPSRVSSWATTCSPSS